MRFLCVAVLCVCIAVAGPAADRGSRVKYVGGTVAELAQGGDGRIHTTDDDCLVFTSKRAEFQVPYGRINLLEYGQRVSRRYGLAVAISPLLVLSKSRKHFLTVGFTDEDGGQQAMIFRVEKDDIRSLLVGLEAKTGLVVQYQDEEARKAGKG